MSTNLQLNVSFRGPLSNPALAIGSNNSQLSCAAFSYAIDGYAYSKSATNPFPLSSGHSTVGAKKSCLFLVQINSSGALSTRQSNIEDNDSERLLRLPEPSAGNVAIGAVKVRCNNAATFTPGTTNFNATDVVSTYYSFAGGGPAIAGLPA